MVAFIVLLQLQSFLLLDSIVDFREEEGFFLPCESGFDLALVHFFSVSLLVDKGLVPFNVDVRNGCSMVSVSNTASLYASYMVGMVLQ